MKKLLLLLFIYPFLLWAGGPNITLVKTTTTKSLSQGSKDTITVSNFDLSGDSVGVMISSNRDSISLEIRYMYITPDATSNETFDTAPVLATETLVSGEQALFSNGINRIAGAYRAEAYIIVTNNKSGSSRTVTIKVYRVTWR